MAAEVQRGLHTCLFRHQQRCQDLYLYFKSSQIPQKAIDDIMLQVHGDMRRFDEAKTLLLRMSHRSFDSQVFLETISKQEHARVSKHVAFPETLTFKPPYHRQSTLNKHQYTPHVNHQGQKYNHRKIIFYQSIPNR